MARRAKKAKPSGTPFLLGLFLLALIAAIHWERRYLLLGLFALVIAAWIVRWLRRRRRARSMAQVDSMGGHEFERFLATVFKDLGYKVKNVGATGSDFGADLVLERKGESIAVQAKHRTGAKVGNDAVQQAVAGAVYYDCEKAIVATNSTFTRAAKEQSRRSEKIPVELWGRKEIQVALDGREPLGRKR